MVLQSSHQIMFSKPKVSVEIFRDAATPTVDIECAEEGIENIRRVYKGIKIVRANRLIDLRSNEDKLCISAPIVPTDRAAISLVLSGRSIEQAGKSLVPHTIGARTVGFALAPLGTAVIDTNNGIPMRTVTHETGHLFFLKESGETYDGVSHCTDDHCIMNAYDIVPEMYAALRRHNVATERFCDECSEQMCQAGQVISR